jgi:hypothetical protein
MKLVLIKVNRGFISFFFSEKEKTKEIELLHRRELMKLEGKRNTLEGRD